MHTVEWILANKGQDLHCIGPRATVVEALREMQRLDVGALIVREGEAPLGIFTERDAARRVLPLGYSGNVRVQQVMRIHPPTVCPADTVEYCMDLMTRRRTRHVLVKDGERLVGIVSIGDTVSAMLAARDRDLGDMVEYINWTR